MGYAHRWRLASFDAATVELSSRAVEACDVQGCCECASFGGGAPYLPRENIGDDVYSAIIAYAARLAPQIEVASKRVGSPVANSTGGQRRKTDAGGGAIPSLSGIARAHPHLAAARDAKKDVLVAVVAEVSRCGHIRAIQSDADALHHARLWRVRLRDRRRQIQASRGRCS